MKQSDDPKSYDALSPQEKLAIQVWIALSIRPADIEFSSTSTGLSLNLDLQEGVFLTNGDLKGGMLAAGYEPTSGLPGKSIDWHFHIQPACVGLHGDTALASVHCCAENGTPAQRRMLRAVCSGAKLARLDRLQKEAETRQNVIAKREAAEQEARAALSAVSGKEKPRKRT